MKKDKNNINNCPYCVNNKCSAYKNGRCNCSDISECSNKKSKNLKSEKYLRLELEDLKEEIKDKKLLLWRAILKLDVAKRVSKDMKSSFYRDFKEISDMLKRLV